MNALTFAAMVLGSWIPGERLLYWSLVFAVALPYVLFYLAYRSRLRDKRDTLQKLMSQPGVFEAYKARFGQACLEHSRELSVSEERDDKIDQIVKNFFGVVYGPSAYYLPICLNVLVIAIGLTIGFLRAGISMGLPSTLESLAQRAPITMFLGFAGAYTLSLYNICQLYRTEDLAPPNFHYTWLHMILASLLAPLLSQAFVPAAANAVAFGIGIFPLKDSFDFAKNFAKKRLEVVSIPFAFERPTLDKLQGLTEDVIERLREEGITSSVCLAYTDPIRLFLKTNFEWPFLIDIIDQALLFNYVTDIKDDGLAHIRPLGIRGSIEMSVLGEPLSDGSANPQPRPKKQAEKPFDPTRVTQAIADVARKLGQGTTPTEVRNLAINLWEDGQVDLIWKLFRAFEETSEKPPASDVVTARKVEAA